MEEYMTSKEIIAKLKKEGWELKGQTGSHTQWYYPVTKKQVTVLHPRKDFLIFKRVG